MRGPQDDQVAMFTLMNPDTVVPKTHPIRGIKALADEALRAMSAEFDAMYAKGGRHSVPPEQLLKAQLLIALFSVRSERQFCEQLAYNLMFRWFLDLPMDGTVFDPGVFTKNRDRLIKHDVANIFFHNVVEQARRAGLISAEHFTVDGTLIEAWASLKSFKRKDGTSKGPDDDDKGNPTVDFRGETRGNETHESTTDRDARLYRKSHGTTAKLSYAGHALMENRHGLLVDFAVTRATGTSEREAAMEMVERTLTGSRRVTLAADKGYDTKDFVAGLRLVDVTPHIARNETARRRSTIDARTTRHEGYAVSQRKRKLVEEIFGWAKVVGGLRKTRYRGLPRVGLHAMFVGAAYTLLRMTRLMAAA